MNSNPFEVNPIFYRPGPLAHHSKIKFISKVKPTSSQEIVKDDIVPRGMVLGTMADSIFYDIFTIRGIAVSYMGLET